MNPQATLGVSGVIHSLNLTSYEAGTSKAGRAYQGGSYVEVTLITDQSLLDGELVTVPATITVRTDERTAKGFGKGELVNWLVTPFVDLITIKGKWVNRVGFRFAAAAGV